MSLIRWLTKYLIRFNTGVLAEVPPLNIKHTSATQRDAQLPIIIGIRIRLVKMALSEAGLDMKQDPIDPFASLGISSTI